MAEGRLSVAAKALFPSTRRFQQRHYNHRPPVQRRGKLAWSVTCGFLHPLSRKLLKAVFDNRLFNAEPKTPKSPPRHMLIGVVSDTHGHVQNTQAAARMLDSLGVEAALHCGDIGSEAIVPLFAQWPTHFVLGNVDEGGITAALQTAIEKAGQTFHGRFGSLELAGVKIALLHGDDERLLQQTISAGKHQLVCHGHTHAARNERIGSTLVLNPGALYRANPHSIALVDLPTLKTEIIPV